MEVSWSIAPFPLGHRFSKTRTEPGVAMIKRPRFLSPQTHHTSLPPPAIRREIRCTDWPEESPQCCLMSKAKISPANRTVPATDHRGAEQGTEKRKWREKKENKLLYSTPSHCDPLVVIVAGLQAALLSNVKIPLSILSSR